MNHLVNRFSRSTTFLHTNKKVEVISQIIEFSGSVIKFSVARNGVRNKEVPKFFSSAFTYPLYMLFIDPDAIAIYSFFGPILRRSVSTITEEPWRYVWKKNEVQTIRLALPTLTVSGWKYSYLTNCWNFWLIDRDSRIGR